MIDMAYASSTTFVLLCNDYIILESSLTQTYYRCIHARHINYTRRDLSNVRGAQLFL